MRPVWFLWGMMTMKMDGNDSRESTKFCVLWLVAKCCGGGGGGGREEGGFQNFQRNEWVKQSNGGGGYTHYQFTDQKHKWYKDNAITEKKKKKIYK